MPIRPELRQFYGREWREVIRPRILERASDPEFAEPDRLVTIVLTVAHLNHVSGDDRDDNLAALCQWCHLHHDQQLHIQSARETRMDRKDAARTLLQEAV